MLTKAEMVNRGYSAAFRACFDFLATYGNAEDSGTTWERCCADAVSITRRYEHTELSAMVSSLMSATFEEIKRLYSVGSTTPPQTDQKPDSGKYKFTL